MVGTPFLYKPSRVLGALGTKNNQETPLERVARRRQFRSLPARHGRLLPLPGALPQPERHDARGQGGWGAAALKGLTGNASYDKAQADSRTCGKRATTKASRVTAKFDKYDKGDGPEYVTLGKFGPLIGIAEPEQVLRLNNILNDLGLDSSSTGSSIAWAMELLPARHHHAAGHRRARPLLGQLRGDRKAAVHDREARRLRRHHRRFGARRGTRQVPGRGARLPPDGEGPVPVRPARRAHPQGLRPRPLGRHARHGPPAQPRHAGNQCPRQRRRAVQDRSSTAAPWRRSRTATRARKSPCAAARTPSPSAIRSACAASTPSCSTRPPCPIPAISPPSSPRMTGQPVSAEDRRDRPQHHRHSNTC
jgi:hypothetical protein